MLNFSNINFYKKRFRLVCIFIFILCLRNTHQDTIQMPVEANNNYELVFRNLIQRQNFNLITQFNNDQAHTFGLKPNKFISLRNDQFHGLYTSTKFNDRQSSSIKGAFQQQISFNIQSKGLSLDSKTTFQPSQCESINVDWTIHNSPVKDQGTCNSCYAHSSLATIQNLMHFEYGITYDLSEQQIAECTFDWAPKGKQYYNNLGCTGGWGWKSLHYAKFYGVTLQANYPYVSGKTGKLGTCNQKEIKGKRFKISDYEGFYEQIWPETQCNILNEKLLQGKTIAVSIWAPKGIQYQFYGTETEEIDIFNVCGPYKELNHQLQLVGSTDKYWKLKNSYGISWGQKGYLYLDKSQGLNCLNICMDFAYPIQLASSNNQ